MNILDAIKKFTAGSNADYILKETRQIDAAAAGCKHENTVFDAAGPGFRCTCCGEMVG